MSKLLVKILSVCAFVVLIPLIVIGSALCVTEARAVTLTIYQIGEERPVSVDGLSVPQPSLAIYIDDVKQVDKEGNALTTVSVQKNTDIEVKLENYDAYTFAGWYKGNIQDITSVGEASFTGSEYLFTIRGNTTLTAIRNIKTYSIEYSGKYDNGDIVDVDPANTTVYYNQKLTTLASRAGGEFGGWYISNLNSSTDSQPTMYANWKEVTGAEEIYTLEPYWTNMMTFKYFASDKVTPIVTEYVSENNLSSYKLLSGEDSRVTSAITKGYSFAGWINEEGNPVDLSTIEFTPGVYNIYLTENVVDYTMNIKYSSISDQIDSISYNVVDGFGTYNITRDFYTLKGFEYNGLLYEVNGNDYYNGSSSLSSVILNSKEIVQVTAVWVSEYPDIDWSIGLRYKTDIGTYKYIYSSDSALDPVTDITEELLYIEDNSNEGFIQLEQSIYNYLTDADINNLYIYNEDGSYQKVVFDYIEVSINGGNLTDNLYMSAEKITFGQIMYQVFDINDIFASVDDSNIYEIYVNFIFKLA